MVFLLVLLLLLLPGSGKIVWMFFHLYFDVVAASFRSGPANSARAIAKKILQSPLF